MNKFKELLFLKNIKGVGKIKINNHFLGLLDESSDLDDLIAIMEFKYKISLDNLENAKQKAEMIYDSVINDSEIKVITIFDDNYPKKLLVMGNKKPLILYVKGNVNALTKPNLAVIGTRKPSILSQKFEENLVKNILNSTNRVIVSGLALGCDKIAHQTTVNENKATIAVLPSGVNIIKPAKHKKLAEEIIDAGGCLISEYEPNNSAFKSTYVERDKVVAAFSDAIFVVECGVKSGTMHTVNAANEYQKQIYTFLPIECFEGLFDGNEFILDEYNNAIKIENIEDLLNDLNTFKVKKEKTSIQQTFDW